MEGGIDDVGLGVLFGLQGYRYEFAGLIMHAEHLEAVRGVGPHTISVPRVKPAMDIDPDMFDNGIPDEMFEKIIALIRIAVPYTGMIISTREGQQVRERRFAVWREPDLRQLHQCWAATGNEPERPRMIPSSSTCRISALWMRLSAG